MTTAKTPKHTPLVNVSCRVRRTIDYQVDIVMPSELTPENMDKLATLQLENHLITHENDLARIQLDLTECEVYAITDKKVQL